MLSPTAAPTRMSCGAMTLTDCPGLHRLAESMGVTLRRHDVGPKGWYDHRSRTISTRRGMSIRQYRSTLGHELGHAHYGDVACRDPVLHVRIERRADLYAARLLISPEEFRDACVWHHDHLGAVADDLEITLHLARVYADHFERLTL